MTTLKVFFAIVIAGAFAGAQAQISPQLSQANGHPSPTPSNDSTSPRRIRAIKISEPIKIDGRLDETSWSQAAPANDFLQQQPNEGAPASEKTEVRVLFDDKNLYVGIHASDSEPKQINARELVRDANFSNDDKIEILLDTYHDRRNAFRFG